MRFALSALFFLNTVCAFTQVTISGQIRDSKSDESLPFASVMVKSSKKGTLANSEGVFSINVDLKKDTVTFSYLGYKTFEIPAFNLVKKKIIPLERKEILLKELTIHADDDYLYDILDQCRRKMLKDRYQRVAKVYYGLETQAKGQPIEMVECYYNGYLTGISVDSLLLKNGRVGLAELDQRLFLTMSSSKAIGNMNLLFENEQCPGIPLQYKKNKLKKNFSLIMDIGDDDMFHIKFKPKGKSGSYFTGDLWINKKNLNLLKIDLSINNAGVYPFIPIFSLDVLSDVNVTMSQTFRTEDNSTVLDHINFNYQVTYKSVRDTPLVKIRSLITRVINTTGVMYFHDYDQPFILPYFNYDVSFNDYRKISIIPYNSDFWNNNSAMVLTAHQKEDIGFFSHEGQLVNYDVGNYGKNFLNLYEYDKPVFEYYYSFWSPNERIILNRKMDENGTWPPEKINQHILSDLYHLEVQLLLDINQVDCTLRCRSYSVFDAKNTFYHLPDQPNTNTFINIYFDIWEIERRKMEAELNKMPHTLAQIDSIYRGTVLRAENLGRRYLKDVQIGKEEKSLRKWNAYIVEKLGIDNMKLFGSATKPDSENNNGK